MSTYNLYLCDDALPSFNGGLLQDDDIIGHKALCHILQDKKQTWCEPPVKSILEKAVANPYWRVSAARNPEFFLKDFQSSLNKPDVLIFDWDYAGSPKTAEDYLTEFLEQTYCIVRIYTGVDKIEQINDVLKKDKFIQYKSRITVSEKSKVDADSLLKEVQAIQENNFSYKFGPKLRQVTLNSLEAILVSLGKNSIDEVMTLLNTNDTAETDFKEILVEKMRNHLKEAETLLVSLDESKLSSKDGQSIIDSIAEKLRNDLNNCEIQLISESKPGTIKAGDSKVADAAASLWSYRLYYTPSDKRVRRGDIVKRKSDCQYFIVVTGDCDLNLLWRKNYGYVNLVPILQIKKGSDDLTFHFNLAKYKKEKTSFAINSLKASPNGFAEGSLLLPFVPVNNERFNFIAFPKEITSVHTSNPISDKNDVDKVRNTSLTYELFSGYDRVCTISEPFLTPFVDTLLGALSGLGVPDYPEAVKSVIDSRIKASLA
jgi:hypothetical protein